MKTSYKILTTFAITVIIGLLITNISLKAKYINGDFDTNESRRYDAFSDNNYDKKKFADFKHIVFNGAITTKNGKEVKFNPQLSISSHSNLENAMGINKNLSPLLRYHISNDTLYISFKKNSLNEENLNNIRYYNLYLLNAKNLSSVSIKNLTCNFDTIITQQPFELSTDSASAILNYIKTNHLTLHIGEQSNINFNGPNGNYTTSGFLISESVLPITNTNSYKIDRLDYSIKQGSSINISNKTYFGSINCLNPSKYLLENNSNAFSIVSPIVQLDTLKK